MRVKKKTSTALGRGSLTIRGQEIPVVTESVEQTRLRFFKDNPRIYSIARANGKDPTQEEIQEQLLQLEHVRSLIIDPQKCVIGSDLSRAPREVRVASMTKSRNLHRPKLADLAQGVSKG